MSHNASIQSFLKNQFLSRVTLLVLGVYLAFIIDSSYHWVGDVVFLDGLVLIIGSNLTGLIYLISSADWIVTVTAWELFNLSLYLLTAMTPTASIGRGGGAAALSAAIKYFLLSAVTTTLLLLGVAFLYAQTGSTHYDSAWVGIIVTFLFKLSAAPFHLVGPDIYDGVPTTTTTWMIHIPKFATLQAGLASIIVGSIGLGSQFPTGSSAAGIFALLLGIGQAIGREVTLISQLSGLFSLNPGAALALGFSLFGLAGVPPIAGFFGKLLALQSFISQGCAAYYLYLIKVTHFDRPAAAGTLSRMGSGLALPASSTFNVLFLMSPASFIGLASAAYF
ncbi:NADH dehydrogenase subunit 2 [Phlyctochytrium arcticum]|nr:NADH dehydrogenase subunit 2 [Phlyctochytrium arcticum]